MKIGLLCSGNLGYRVLSEMLKNRKIEFVMTDSKSDSIITTAQENEIPIFKGNPRNGRASAFLEGVEIDILLSANYLFLIDKELIRLPKITAVNIHGSLLPKYRGRTPHVWAIINGETETGITAHVIDEDCDTGDIVEQVEVTIQEDDTGASILEKFNKLYIPLIDSVLAQIESDNLNPVKQDNKKATYFGKRTPDDGKIDWNWQKERIKNWVRAQAQPYPGAYTYLEGKKVTIDRIEYSDYGFSFDYPNGMVLRSEPLTIKTPNGAVEPVEIRENIKFKTGQILK